MEYLCEFCNVNVPISAKENHIQGKKHKLRVHAKYVLERKEKCGIYVTGFSQSISGSDIQELFSKHGKISDFYYGAGFCIIQFENEEPADNLIKQGRVSFMGKILMVKRRKVKENEKVAREDSPEENEIEKICNGLNNLPNFDSEVTKLEKMLDVSSDMIDKYKHLCRDLERILQEPYPHCRVYAFGSTITGLASQSSDVDIYVELPSRYKCDSNFASKAVSNVRKYLTRKPRIFQNCIAIPKAKTPIMKCVHTSTKIRCDFNFKNMLGVCNSNLIKYYISIDPKIKTLMILLKQWSKAHEFTSYNLKFTNYALVMMVIFFVQQKPYCLPSVQLLQQNPECEIIQEGWNGGFQSIEFVSPALKQVKFRDLVIEFFNYYSQFDYNLQFICPYLGITVNKTDFLNPNTIHQGYERYINNIETSGALEVETPICIQDPFEHNHNLTKAIRSKFLEEFISYFKFVVDTLSSQQPSLYKILTNRPTFSFNGVKMSDNDCEFPITMGSYLTYLKEKAAVYSLQGDEDEKIRKLWFETVTKFVTTFLTDVLKFQIIADDSDNGNSSKAQKLNGQLSAHDNIFDSMAIHCIGEINTWEARKSISKDVQFPDMKSLLEKEMHLSNYIKDVLYKDINTLKPIIEINVILYGIKNPISALCTINKCGVEKNGYFNTLSVYLSSKIPSFFALYEKELNDQVKSNEHENENGSQT